MRIIDLLISLSALLFLSPLLMILCLILKFTGEGEIFFLQDRVGQYGKKFKVIKFATMLKNSPNMGAGTITAKDDPRILPFGRILRKTKINELPQLINVILGQMSLIGPRPHAEQDLKGIAPEILVKILQLKPGMSGIGSIIFRNEEEILNTLENPRPLYDDVIAPYKASLEIWYFKNRSIYLNVQLILLTVVVVIRKKSVLLHEIFTDLPQPPEILKKYL